MMRSSSFVPEEDLRVSGSLGMALTLQAVDESVESLDYEKSYSKQHLQRGQRRSAALGKKIYGYSGATVGRWCVTLLTGVVVAVVAFAVTLGMAAIIEHKVDRLRSDLAADYFWWAAGNLALYNLGLALLGGLCVVFAAPEAASSSSAAPASAA